MDLWGVTNQSWVEVFSKSIQRTMLDNPMASAMVARRHKKLSSREGILPNPSGGVNTHLSRNVAYVIGIVPIVHSTYSASLWNGKGISKRGGGIVVFIGRVKLVCYPTENFDHHERLRTEIFPYRGGARWHRQSGSGR